MHPVSSFFFFLFLLTGPILVCGEPPLLKNSGFEELDSAGYPAGWSHPEGNVWSSSTENVYEGTRSFLYSNTKKGFYKFIVQKIDVRPGEEYEYSCMAKIVHNDKPAKSYPMIFLEYYAKNGSEYAGGEYNCMIQPLNTDWVLVSGRAKVPQKEGLQVLIGLAVKPAGTADVKVWFDKMEIKKAEISPFSGVLTTNRYRDQAFQGMVKVFCGLEEGSSAFDASNIQLQVRRDGKTLLDRNPDQILPDRIIYTFDSTELSPGKYELFCSWKDPVMGKDFSVSQPFTKLDGKPEYKCYVDEYNRMIVDGKPFFPLGMFFYTLSKADIPVLKTTKMNSLMVYSPPGRFNDYEKTKYLLDLLQQNDLKLFYSIKGFVSAMTFDDGSATEKLQAKGLSILNEVKEHPAIIAWYINDELQKSFVKDAVRYRRAVEEADPSRPTWAVLANPDGFRCFVPASDVHGSDPYPIPEFTPKMALQMTRQQQRAVMGSKMLIQVPQAFSWGAHWLHCFGYTKEMCAQCRRPSKEEIEAMSWMCIAGGANGLIYYSYQDMRERDKTSDILPRIPFDTAFGELREVTDHIMKFENVLLSAGEPIPFEIVEDGNQDVGVRAYELDGITWILAVNSDEKESRNLILEMGREVTLQGMEISEPEVQVSNRTVSVSLKPLQTVFIRLR